MKDARKRGVLFEQFIAHLLEEQGFVVTINPKTAKPRQTDLCARLDELFFIVEAKWQKKRVQLDDVESVQLRLHKTTSDVFACVFSMSGYARTAETFIASNRSPEVLLFKESEVQGLAEGELAFTDLLRQKRDEVRTNARVWFSEWTPSGRRMHWSSGSGPEVLHIGGQFVSWLLAKTQGDQVLFAREMLDLGSYSDSACSLRLQVGIRTAGDLAKLLRTLKTYLDLSGTDSFAIHQRTAGWYGSGAENFVAAVEQWEQRYQQLNWPNYHHSEELAYFDQMNNGGLMSLTLRQRVGEHAFLHSGFVEIITSGIPVDGVPIKRLCEKTNNDRHRFEFVSDKPLETYRFNPHLEVRHIGMIVDPRDAKWACGIIVRNPFYNCKTRGSFGGSDFSRSPIRFLSNTEVLFCRLKSWHGVDEVMDRYELEYVEGCWIEHIPVLYVACNWP
jgi:hypothetical protein